MSTYLITNNSTQKISEDLVMKTKNNFALLLGSASILAVFAMPAHAAGTGAGQSIVNTATVDYEISSIAQNQVTDSNTIVVDRKVNLVVAEVGSSATNVTPGGQQMATTFTVTNLSNAPLDFALAAAQSASDDFDVTDITIYLDDGNGTFDGADTLVTFLDELAADDVVTVHVVANIPLSPINGDIADVILTATAHEAGGAAALGALVTETSGADTAGVDTVLADGAGVSDGSRDGAFSAQDSYSVVTASLTVSKTSRVISDPFNLTTNPKAIPGAVIEYCIAVSNGAGAATATNVAVTDVLSADTTYDGTFGIFVDGTVNGSAECQADGASGGSHSAGTVTGSLSDIAADETRTLYFRATIN